MARRPRAGVDARSYLDGGAMSSFHDPASFRVAAGDLYSSPYDVAGDYGSERVT